MSLSILRNMLHTPVVEIIQHLKCSTGLTVKELATLMNMSYMGVKQHCVEMEEKGYLDTFRRPVPHGRPQKLYRLTEKLDLMFPSISPGMLGELLAQAKTLFGPAAPEKLLHAWFQTKAERWLVKVEKESALENRAIVLARLRTAEGHMCMVESASNGSLRLVDYHQPLGALMAEYPVLAEIECDVLERLLGQPVERAVVENSGLKQVVFLVRPTHA